MTNHPTEEIELTTRDGLRLTADIHRPDGPARAAAVVVHGFSGSRRGPGVLEQARDLVRQGFIVLAHDGRGHGASEGICTLGDLEALDVEAVVDHAHSLHDKVVVVGASMGAISVIRYAADHPDVDGVVAVSGPSHWKLTLTPMGLASAALTRTYTGRAVAKKFMGVTVSPTFSYPEPPVELVTRITAPLAIIHGREDKVIRSEAAVQLHQAATGPRLLNLVNGMGHAFEEFGRPFVTRAAQWALAPALG